MTAPDILDEAVAAVRAVEDAAHQQGVEIMTITHETASAAILAACDAETLVQRQWHGRGSDGRAIACLLGSIGPGVKSASDCNAELMPLWLAELTITLFDGLAEDAIYPTARRYGAAVRRWGALTEPQWRTVLNKSLIFTIDDAVASARPLCAGKPYWPQVEAACEQCKAAILSGTAAGAAGAAAWAAAGAAGAAAWAAAWAAAGAAAAEAYLRLFDFLLDCIEQELN